MNANLEKFIKRNQKRNFKLYLPECVEGVDYVTCPVSKQRLSMIKKSYIERVLGLTVAEYDQQYPGARKISQRRKNNIKMGLKEIDVDSGLTKYELGQQKARETLKLTDENGISGYKKKGQKTRDTHLSKIDESGRNGYSQIASKAIIKGNKTKALKGQISINKDEFSRYKVIVLYLTQKHRAELTKGYVVGLAGKNNAWHIDHRFSILKGFQNKVSPFIIGHIKNLQMLPWEQNISKHSKCSIELSEITLQCGYTAEKSTLEFEQVYKFIIDDIQNNIPPNAAFLIERMNETILRN